MITFKNKEQFCKSKGIYQIKNTITGFVYVGQTNERFERRLWLHDFLLRNNRHDNINLQNDYVKYGEDVFVFEVLQVTNINDNLDDLEKQYIKAAKQSKRCYNISDGGRGALGVPMTEANRRFHAEHNRILNTGKKASDETKRKMSESRMGHPVRVETIDKMLNTKAKNYLDGVQTNIAKITAKEAYEIKEALINGASYDELSQKYNISRSNINAIRSNRSWKFVEVDGWNEYCSTHRARQSRSAN